MRIIRFTVPFFIVFIMLPLSAELRHESIFCEPSLLYPELSFLEEAECFSFIQANRVYEDSEVLKLYLDRFPGNVNQNGYRYRYYLRRNRLLPAIITLIHMVNTQTLPYSISDPFTEINNIITQGIKEIGSKDSLQHDQPFKSTISSKTMREFQGEFFYLLSYVASYVSEYPSLNKDSIILFRTISILLSNIASGIDWEGDFYIHEKFNRLVAIKNKELLESYISLFFFHIKGEYTDIPSFSKYLELKESGVVCDIRKSSIFLSHESLVRNIIAGFFIDNIHKMPDIVYTDSLPEILTQNKKEICQHLSDRSGWLSTIPNVGEDVRFFNKAVQIVEQCPGSLSFPFVIDGDKIYILKDSSWLVDVAVAVKYLMTENVSAEDGDTILRGAVRASLEKAMRRENRSMDEEFLLYTLKIGKSAEVLRSFFASVLHADGEKNRSQQITEAANFLSKILF